MTADEENRERCPDSIFPLHLHIYVSSALLLSKADYDSKRTNNIHVGPIWKREANSHPFRTTEETKLTPQYKSQNRYS